MVEYRSHKHAAYSTLEGECSFYGRWRIGVRAALRTGCNADIPFIDPE